MARVVQVKLAVHEPSGLEVAIKVLPKPPSDDAKLQKVLRGEVACFERLRAHGVHSNLVGLIEVTSPASLLHEVHQRPMCGHS